MKRCRLAASLLALALLCAVFPLGTIRAGTPSVPSQAKLPRYQGSEVPFAARIKIDPDLLKQLLEAKLKVQENGISQLPPVSYLVYLRESAPLQDLPAANPQDKRVRIVERLQSTAQHSQAGVTAYLAQRLAQGKISRYQAYWIFNGLAVDGDLETALQLALRPEVAYLRANRTYHLSAPTSAQADAAITGQPEWGLTKISAPRVWSTYGVTGAGIVVANLDSGVDWTHPALQTKYRGYDAQNPGASTHDHNWFDPTGTYPNAPGPNIPHISGVSDHGTHTMGTMVGAESSGANLIGVAPGARWIAAKVFDDNGNATSEWIHAGFQWCLAPTDLRGANPDPHLAPDIVNNSWGDANGSDMEFQPDVTLLRTAGIFAVYSVGNEGPTAGTADSPASFPNAFSIGATDSQDQISGFSSRGPSPWGQIKPEVVAPGSGIRSAIAGGSYETWSGTSMAAPHAAGLAALLWQADRFDATGSTLQGANRTLTVTTTEQVIMHTAVDLGAPGADNTYGQGRIDAYQAVGTVVQNGTFAGRVLDAATGEPIADVLITMRNPATAGQASTRTEADGTYAFAVAAGAYNVTVHQFGYDDVTVWDIPILARTVTQLDFKLQPQARGSLQGHVTLASDGQPVSATVRLLGTPIETGVDAGGYYTFSAPAGSYTVRVIANEPGYRGAEAVDIRVTAHSVVARDFQVTWAPRLLLVDADAWTASRFAPYYQALLDNLLYSYHTHTIGALPQDIPDASVLERYDVVIWSQPQTSPGYISAWAALSAYLDGGGKLLLSGQNVGYWDYESSYAPEAYTHYLHAHYLGNDSGSAPLAGVANEILAGIQLTYNTPDSARNQTDPDAIAPADLMARPIAHSAEGTVLGLRADSCTQRVVYLSFGLEGVGPAVARQQVLDRLITGFMAQHPPQGVDLYAVDTSLAATVGQSVSYDMLLTNLADTTFVYELTAISPLWEARLYDPESGRVITRTEPLTPCATVPLKLEISIPEDAVTGQTETTLVRAVPVGILSAAVTRTLYTTAFQPWVLAQSLPTSRYRLGAVARDCAIYAIGGRASDDNGPGAVLGTVEKLDLTSGGWTALASKPTPASGFGTVELNGRVFALGGYDPSRESQYLDTVEVYDIASNRWSSAPALPQPRAGMAASVWNGRIYVFGGIGSSGESNASYVYDPRTGVWSNLAPVPGSGISYANAVTLNGLIYLAGGWPNRAQLWRYDPAADSWTTLASMPFGRHSFAMTAAGGMIYVAGGGNSWNGLRSAERYDPVTNAWIEITPLQSASRTGATGAFANGRFYVLGGRGATITGDGEYLDIAAPLSGSRFTASAPLARVGDRLQYTLVVRNAANQPVGASWIYTLPVGLDYVEGSSTGGAVYDRSGNALAWAGALSAASSMSFGFAVTISPSLANESVLTSTAYLTGGGCAPMVLSTATRVSMPSLERSTKAVDRDAVAPGDRLHYTIELANDSPYTVSQAILTDELPVYTTLVSGSLSGGASYNAASRRIEWRGTLAPAETVGHAFDWVDATTGLALGLTDDSCTGPLDLGFTFHYYGRAYTQVYVNSNGMVLFEKCSPAYSNTNIPNAAEPNAFVAPFWDDLVPSGGGYMAVFGEPPHRYAVIEWRQAGFYEQAQTQTFEVILYEGSNNVVFQYLTLTGERGGGNSATVGIENQDGTADMGYLYNGAPAEHALRDRLALELPHSSTSKATRQVVSYDVLVDETVPPGAIIRNTATIDDGWRIHTRSVTSTVLSPSLTTSRKQVQPARALAGDTLTYTLHLVNTGPITATELDLSDVLPPELTFVPGSLTGAGANYDPASRRIVWQGTLGMDPTGVLIAYQARLAEQLPANIWFTNTAMLSVRSVALATLEAGVLVNSIDLNSSHKSAHIDAVAAGDAITYTIRLQNTGLAVAPHAALTDVLPAGLQLAEGSLVGGTYDRALRAILWQGALEPQANHQVRFRTVTTPSLGGATITNTALVDDGLGNVLLRAAEVRVRPSTLAASDMVAEPGQASPGDVVTYTLRLRNTSTDTISAALSCLPAPLTVISDTLYASAGEVYAQDGSVLWNGTLWPQGMVMVRFGVRVPLGMPAQTLITEARLSDTTGAEVILTAPVVVSPWTLCLPLIRK